MKLSANCVGLRSKPMTVVLSPRRTMNFAAALGDANPAYLDDTLPGGIVAPPMLAVALTWPMTASFACWWGDAGISPDVLRQQVHYDESILWHRCMRPGDELTIRGEIHAVVRHRAGTLLTIRYTAVDHDGAAVFEEDITGLLREVALEAGPGPVVEVPSPVTAPPTAACGSWEADISIDPLAAHCYDGCTGIVFPIHTSAAFARSAGLPAPIYQGTATLGLALREIVAREAGGAPALLAEVHAGFRGMVFPGAIVTLRVLGSLVENRRKIVYFEVETPAGAHAIRGGRAVLRVGDQCS